jgi:predicted nucleic acid-binding protein
MATITNYNYTRLAVPNEIRLVQILPGETSSPMLCEILHTSLGSHASYEALSYTWGNLDSSLTIRVNSSALVVSRNLYEALQRLRLSSKMRTIWIDAISINQADIAERSQQVGVMRNNFSHAFNVVVWLGEESMTSNRAIAFLKEMGGYAINQSKDESGPLASCPEPERDQVDDSQLYSVAHPKLRQHHTKDRAYNVKDHAMSAGDEHLLWGMPVLYYDFSDSALWDYISESRNTDWEALDELLARPWWARTWVVQEVWNAASVTLQCGGASILTGSSSRQLWIIMRRGMRWEI